MSYKNVGPVLSKAYDCSDKVLVAVADIGDQPTTNILLEVTADRNSNILLNCSCAVDTAGTDRTLMLQVWYRGPGADTFLKYTDMFTAGATNASVVQGTYTVQGFKGTTYIITGYIDDATSNATVEHGLSCAYFLG